MVQEFLLEVIQGQESNFFKLSRKSLKGIQKEIDSILEKNYRNSIVDWKVYTSFPFE